MPSQYSQVLHSVNFHNPTWDVFILLFWVIVALIYSFAASRGRIITILVSVYMSELIVLQAPFLGTLVASKSGLALYVARLISFLALFTLLFLLLARYAFRTTLEHNRLTSWVYSFVFSILQVGFLISVVLSFLPPEMKQNFAPLVRLIFVSNVAEFVWLLLPIIYLVIAGSTVHDHQLD